MGFICAPQLKALLDGGTAVAATPEITAFETPEGAPAWGFEALDFSVEKDLPQIKSFVDRTSLLALAAAKSALADAGLLDKETRKSDIGCAYGSTLGCLEAMSIFWQKIKTSDPKFAQPVPFTHGYANSPSSLLCIEYALRGPAATFSGERLAGIEALLFAFDQIAAGSGDIILAGASESLTPAAHRHLLASGELSRTGQWDDGIIPGEGAAMLVLESEDSAKSRGARVLAEIEGVSFFPLDPKGTVAPIRIGTDPDRTLVFVSTPNVHPAGGWIKPLLTSDVAAIATKFLTGDMLSVSPVLGAALGAGCLSGRYPIARNTGEAGLPLLHPQPSLRQPCFAVATGYDPGGSLGVVMLNGRK